MLFICVVLVEHQHIFKVAMEVCGIFSCCSDFKRVFVRFLLQGRRLGEGRLVPAPG